MSNFPVCIRCGYDPNPSFEAAVAAGDKYLEDTKEEFNKKFWEDFENAPVCRHASNVEKANGYMRVRVLPGAPTNGCSMKIEVEIPETWMINQLKEDIELCLSSSLPKNGSLSEVDIANLENAFETCRAINTVIKYYGGAPVDLTKIAPIDDRKHGGF